MTYGKRRSHAWCSGCGGWKYHDRIDQRTCNGCGTAWRTVDFQWAQEMRARRGKEKKSLQNGNGEVSPKTDQQDGGDNAGGSVDALAILLAGFRKAGFSLHGTDGKPIDDVVLDNLVTNARTEQANQPAAELSPKDARELARKQMREASAEVSKISAEQDRFAKDITEIEAKLAEKRAKLRSSRERLQVAVERGHEAAAAYSTAEAAFLKHELEKRTTIEGTTAHPSEDPTSAIAGKAESGTKKRTDPDEVKSAWHDAEAVLRRLITQCDESDNELLQAVQKVTEVASRAAKKQRVQPPSGGEAIPSHNIATPTDANVGEVEQHHRVLAEAAAKLQQNSASMEIDSNSASSHPASS